MEDRFCEKCDCELEEYEYKGVGLCSDCVLEKLEEENKIESWTTKSYMLTDGEYLGNDNEDDICKIINKISEKFNIKELI